jgi:hypothetical protein
MLFVRPCPSETFRPVRVLHLRIELHWVSGCRSQNGISAGINSVKSLPSSIIFSVVKDLPLYVTEAESRIYQKGLSKAHPNYYLLYRKSVLAFLESVELHPIVINHN